MTAEQIQFFVDVATDCKYYACWLFVCQALQFGAVLYIAHLCKFK